MAEIKSLDLVTTEYLAAELESPTKHEYVGGQVYALPDERILHHRIATNVLGCVGARLRGRRHRVFNSDTKLRIRLADRTCLYYPAASVILQSNPGADFFQDEPVVVFEVLSRKTRRVDEVEKKDAYLTIPSLSVYVLIDSEMPAVVAFRRTSNGFVREVYDSLDAVLPLPEIEIDLPLTEIYENAEFMPEPEDDE